MSNYIYENLAISQALGEKNLEFILRDKYQNLGIDFLFI